MNTAITGMKAGLAAAAALLLAAGVAHSTVRRADPAPAVPVETADARSLFPDAPDGVDPMVTGPVSASFKQKQADLGCEQAAWPKVPADCYPR